MSKHQRGIFITWWNDLLSSDNSRVNTGVVLSIFAVFNAFAIINWNFFVYHKPLDYGTVTLLTTMIGLGGWSYHTSMKAPGQGPPPTDPVPRAKPAPLQEVGQ